MADKKEITLKDARRKDPSIQYADVKHWFETSFTRKTNLKGYNSYVADYPYQEDGMGLLCIDDLEDQDFKIGLLVIDIFTKSMTVVP